MGRPLGITVIAAATALFGLVGVVVGLSTMGVINLNLGGTGETFKTYGAIQIVEGVLNLIVAWGLFALKRWAWWVAVIVMIASIIGNVWTALGFGINSAV